VSRKIIIAGSVPNTEPIDTTAMRKIEGDKPVTLEIDLPYFTNSATPTERLFQIFPSWVEIDLSALSHNIRSLKKLAGPGRLLMVCVKSNAYGHGLTQVSLAAEAAGADRLAVAQVDEGLTLRRAGLKIPIHVLMEPTPEAAMDMARQNLIASLSSLEIIEQIADEIDQPLVVHVEVDTGMGRVPLQVDQVADFLVRLKKMRRFVTEGLFSHFSSAGEPDNPCFDRFTRAQLESFKQLCVHLQRKGFQIPLKHMAGSDAVAFYPQSYMDMIRPGAWIYGYKNESVGLDLKPVLSWKTTIFKVTHARAGKVLGYEMSFRPERNTRIAHLPVGYGDGYPRALSNISEVLIKGRRAPVVALIGMESMMIDVGDIPGELKGQEVTLIGSQGSEQITAAELGSKIGQFGVMITCGIKEKVERIYRKM
jgi:alanine racemase